MDTRTKRILAEDRFVVAERQLVDTEHRRSTGYLQSISHEQKLLERRNSPHPELNSRIPLRSHSTGEMSLVRSSSWNDGIAAMNQNHLLLPKIHDFCRRHSASSDGEGAESPGFLSDKESADDDDSQDHVQKGLSQSTIARPPSVAIIPPDGDNSFFIT